MLSANEAQKSLVAMLHISVPTGTHLERAVFLQFRRKFNLKQSEFFSGGGGRVGGKIQKLSYDHYINLNSCLLFISRFVTESWTLCW